MIAELQQAEVLQLASLHGLSLDDFMAMMAVYFDDSGTHKESEIAVAACLVSDVQRWAKLEPLWKDVLEGAGVLSQGFKMADFVAHKPPFDGWSQIKRDQVLKNLISLINSCSLAGMITAVFKKDYDAVIQEPLLGKLGRYHYTFCVNSCIAHLGRWLVLHRQPMDYIFDRMTKGKHEIDSLFDSLLEYDVNEPFGIAEDGWSYQSSRKIVQLQAADILAWEANKYMREFHGTTKEPRKSFQALINGRDVKACFFDLTTLPSFAREVKANYDAHGWRGGPLGGFLPV